MCIELILMILLSVFFITFLFTSIRMSFNSIKKNDYVMYIEEGLQVYDKVLSNADGVIYTKLGKKFTFKDLLTDKFYIVDNK